MFDWATPPKERPLPPVIFPVNVVFLAGMIALTASAQMEAQPMQNAPPQEVSKPAEADVQTERWNLFYQAAAIGDAHREQEAHNFITAVAFVDAM